MTEQDAQTLRQHAEILYAQGEVRAALHAAAQALEIAPHDAALLSFTGLIAVTLGDAESAAQLWRQAIALDPALAEAHFNLGLLLAKRGQPDEAEHCYRQALDLDPRNAAAYCNLGNLLIEKGREDGANGCYRQAALLKPDWAAPHYNLGNQALRHGQWRAAAQYYRRALAAAPEDAASHAKLGLALARLGQTAEAEQHYRQAIALNPGDAEAFTNLGLLLADSQPEEAERCYRQALATNPAEPETLCNLGNLLARQEREDEAEDCYRAAIALAPDSAAARSNLGVLLAACKRDAEAEQSFRQALACDPRHALAGANLGYLLLAEERWEEGWAWHEMRLTPQERPAVDAPQWQGEPLHGKTLLVLPEQGYGDNLQFVRYVPLLKARGAACVVLVCRPPLKALFSTLAGVDRLLDTNEAPERLPPVDYWTSPLSAPYHCRTRPDNIPAAPYLHALPERLARWSPRVPQHNLRVGLAWRGNPLHHNDKHRSLPSLATLAPLWTVPGVQFVSLQQEAEPENPAQPILNLGAECADFADTAALIQCLDLVISVDSAAAHLAGALGKACWVMLPDYRTDWRWLRGREDSPWYPGMRLFRQRRRGEWGEVVLELQEALVERMASGTSR